ncbi:MAG: hypothetical protein ACFFCI_23565, partial [Promethearchaeota archaeon]
LISTEGNNGHNFIIVPRNPINIIILCDLDDPIRLWREFGEEIAERFLEMYGSNVDYNNISQFKDFAEIVKEMCMQTKYCV